MKSRTQSVRVRVSKQEKQAIEAWAKGNKLSPGRFLLACFLQTIHDARQGQTKETVDVESSVSQNLEGDTQDGGLSASGSGAQQPEGL